MAIGTEVGQVLLKLVYDESDLEQQGDKLSLKLGAKLKTAGAVGGAALAAGLAVGISKAIEMVGELANKAVEAYGEFEQLRDGARIMFGDVSETIEKDAIGAYNDLNMNARNYIESINQIGASYIASMGDQQLAYETARKGMMAISDFATATGKDIQTLNNEFQILSRSTKDYTRMARYFSGILPQTADDFLKQAQAAGFVKEQYGELTDVPLAEYQQAVAAMLEKGVKEFGLLGNTARESAETLTGALGASKAAIDNLITGLADPEANIADLAGRATTAFIAYARQHTKAFSQALSGILDALKTLDWDLIFDELGKALLNTAPKLIDVALTVFERALMYAPKFAQLLVDLISRVVKVVTPHIPALLSAVVEAILGIVEVLTQPNNLTLIVEATLTLLGGIIEAIPLIIEPLVRVLPQIVDNIVTWLTDSDNMQRVTIATLVLLKGIILAVPKLVKTLGTALGNLFKKAFDRKYANVEKWFTTEGIKAINGFMFAFNDIKRKMGILGKAASQAFSTAFNEIKDRTATIIQDAARAFDAFSNKAADVANKAKNAFMQFGQYVYNSLPPNVIGAMDDIWTFFDDFFNATWNNFNAIGQQAYNVFYDASSAIRNTLTWLGNRIADIFGWIGDIANNLGNGIADAFWGAFNSAKRFAEDARNFLRNIFSTVGGLLREPINAIIDAINDVFVSINALRVPDWVPFIGGSHTDFKPIPRLAEGGYVGGATTALIGEQGKEVVIPLERNTDNWAGLLAAKLDEQFAQGQSSRGGINIYMTNNIDNDVDVDRMLSKIETTIRRLA